MLYRHSLPSQFEFTFCLFAARKWHVAGHLIALSIAASNSGILLGCFPWSSHLYTEGGLLPVSSEYIYWLLYLGTQQPAAGVVFHSTDVAALRFCL